MSIICLACLLICLPTCMSTICRQSFVLFDPYPRLLFTMTRQIYLSCMFKMSTWLSTYMSIWQSCCRGSVRLPGCRTACLFESCAGALSAYLAVHLPVYLTELCRCSFCLSGCPLACLFDRAVQVLCLPNRMSPVCLSDNVVTLPANAVPMSVYLAELCKELAC
jgi:hypothetical protein